MTKLVHILNPSNDSLGKDPSCLREHQKWSYESILSAINYTRLIDNKISIITHAVCFPEDKSAVPTFVDKVSTVERSSKNISGLKSEKKLPIFMDILNAVDGYGEEVYFIYTNADIVLAPHFYTFTVSKIRDNFDAFTITRRTVNKPLEEISSLDDIIGDIGVEHPGHDTFIFSSHIKNKLDSGMTLLGAKYFVPPVLSNMISHAKNWQRLTDKCLTFHIGDERVWQNNSYKEVAQFNYKIGKEMIRDLINKELLVDPFFVKIWKNRFEI